MSRSWKKPSIYNIKEVAELSMPVLSANYHQYLYLNKQLRILDRSENTFINNITIEQKIMYRRYMEKLYRSKINYARMWGNKDMERRLRGQKLSYLNTGGGDMEAEAAFLKLLQRRALSAQLPRMRSSSDSRDIDTFVNNIKLKEASNRSSQPLQTPTTTDSENKCLRSAATSSRSVINMPVPHKQATLRPVTAIGALVDKEFNVMSKIPGSDTATKIQNYINIIVDIADDLVEAEATSVERADPNEVPKLELRPKTCSGKIQRRYTTGNVDTKYLIPTPPQQPRKKRRSIFIENSRQDEINKKIEKLKKRDFTAEIEQFCASCEPYILEKDVGYLDYYSKKSYEQN